MRHQVRNLHREDDDANAPTIDYVIISFLVRLQNHFRSQVAGSTAHGLKTKVEIEGLVSEGIITHLQPSETVHYFSQTKIGDFDNRWHIFSQKDILQRDGMSKNMP
jgi:hypothetical protein